MWYSIRRTTPDGLKATSDREVSDMPDNDGWYDLRELAELWGLDIVRVRNAVSFLEPTGIIKVRDKPGDRRTKQVHRDYIEIVRKSVMGA